MQTWGVTSDTSVARIKVLLIWMCGWWGPSIYFPQTFKYMKLVPENKLVRFTKSIQIWIDQHEPGILSAHIYLLTYVHKSRASTKQIVTRMSADDQPQLAGYHIGSSDLFRKRTQLLRGYHDSDRCLMKNDAIKEKKGEYISSFYKKNNNRNAQITRSCHREKVTTRNSDSHVSSGLSCAIAIYTIWYCMS